MTVGSLIDGEPGNLIPVTDGAVIRGDGCFEAMLSVDGKLFALDAHLERLERSASMLDMRLPPRPDIQRWCRSMASSGGNCIVRVVVTRGPAVPGVATAGGFDGRGAHCIVTHHPVPVVPPSLRLTTVYAPWHPAGREWELTGAKTLSYAPNLAAGRLAVAEGFDDALLVDEDAIVLEGPTFAIGWFLNGVLETPSLELGVLASITRAEVLEVCRKLGIETSEVAANVERLSIADEVFVMSTVKRVTPVVAVGLQEFEIGEHTRTLAEAFDRWIAESCAQA